MGKSYSKIISLDDAKQRIGKSDFERLARGFDKITAATDGGLSFGVFNDLVLGNNVPRELAERIFLVTSRSKKFIEKNVCHCAALLSSTPHLPPLYHSSFCMFCCFAGISMCDGGTTKRHTGRAHSVYGTIQSYIPDRMLSCGVAL